MRLAALTLVLASLTLNLQAAPKGRSRRTSHAASGSVHVVRKGETAAKVARSCGLSLRELGRLNPGVRLARLSVGTRLRVGATPAREEAPAPAAVVPSVPLLPLAALPSGPAIAPAPMPHLEGLLPYQVRTSFPVASHPGCPAPVPRNLARPAGPDAAGGARGEQGGTQ